MKRPVVLSFAFIVALTALLTTGCDQPTSKPPVPSVPVAVIADAQPAPPPVQAAALAFGPPTSSIGFTGKKVTGSHTGSFERFAGEVLLGADPSSSQVRLTIEMSSVLSDNAKLTSHLQSADFFDVARFPEATFTSTAITAGGAGGATHTIQGNFTMHGVTKSVAFPATVTAAERTVSLKAAFALDRKAFGLTYPGKADDLINDHVDLFLSITATPPPAVSAPASSTPPASAGALAPPSSSSPSPPSSSP
jgi:polyisoprenoid-binding protein YceI